MCRGSAFSGASGLLIACKFGKSRRHMECACYFTQPIHRSSTCDCYNTKVEYLAAGNRPRFQIPSLAISIPLAEVYHRITFPKEEGGFLQENG